MKPNVGSIDRLLRIVIGLAVLGAGYYYKSWFGLIGIVPLLTATLRFCPHLPDQKILNPADPGLRLPTETVYVPGNPHPHPMKLRLLLTAL
eukprot:gene16875-21516_t